MHVAGLRWSVYARHLVTCRRAWAAALNVDRSTVIRWEFDDHAPLPYLRPKLARLLGQLEHATASRLNAYVVVSLLTGIRTEEARALRWSHVVTWVVDGAVWVPVTEAGFDHERFAIYVWRSVRASGDTKTGEVTPDAGTARAGR